MDNTNKISFLKKWWTSVRPFAFPASTMPVIFGTVLAIVYGDTGFNLLNFILAFAGMVILHSGANILSDIYDYKKGIDKLPNPTSGGIVRGFISTREATWASVILLSAGTIIGLVLTYLTGIWLLIIGFAGLFIGVFYTSGTRFALKYNGLGDFAVFMNFGILGALGAYYVQTTELSWIPVLWAIPMSTLVIAILHANNWRDISSDKQKNIFTIASLLGDKKSLRYYGFLIYGPFFMVLLLILVPYLLVPSLDAMPFTFLITLLALPLAISLWRKALNRKNPKEPLDFIALDGATAKLNLVFGSLCTLALFVHALLQYLV
ncbi:MAG: 1,4-dihydroxy-2-naphthoate octaprenyltransferase [Bacteroidetes bacterium]|nr:1,4-dihydroxy-2-naphthoate octaprenyltransferase [Bacteroidota bacterium]